jgi:hypothetical protein
VRRFAVAVTAALAFGLAGGGATLGGPSIVDAGYGVTVGSTSVEPAAIEREAGRLAQQRRRRLPAARRAAADRAVERLWLEGEAAERGLLRDPAAHPALVLLRAEVADELAGAWHVRDAGGFARAFEGFHRRWRSRTRCEPAYRDPYADRCANRAGAAAGTCRWMGEATLCALARRHGARWLVVQDAASARRTRLGARRLPGPRRAHRLEHAPGAGRPLVARLRSRRQAVGLALAVYESARAIRERAARIARRRRAAAAAARAAERRREARARERTERMRDPTLSEAAVAAARPVCARQAAASDPYLFGFGMQDVIGAAEGLVAARAALARGLAGSAQDSFDRRKLRPLLGAVAEGNRRLARLAAAEAAGDHARAAALVARFGAQAESERALARRLGLGDCLVHPGR